MKPTHDGVLATKLETARSRADRLVALDAFEEVKSGELGPKDAAALARMSLRGGSESEERAREIIVTRFLDDPEIVLAIFDLISQGKPTRSTAEFLESVMDGSLPAPGSRNWPRAVRQGFLDRSLELRAADSDAMDELVMDYAISLDREANLLRQTSHDPALKPLPSTALENLTAARADRVRAEMGVEQRVLLRERERQAESRRRLAADVIEDALVRSMSVLDMVALEGGLLVPSEASVIESIREEAVATLPSAGHVLEQMILVEQAIGEIWNVVLQALVRREQVNNQETSG